MAIRMGKWQCPNCLHENDGPVGMCASCGFPKPANVRYYLPGDAPPITDPALIAEAKFGPKWVCSFCSSPNVQSATACVRCAHPRPNDAESFPVREYSNGETPRSALAAKEIDYREEQQRFHNLMADEREDTFAEFEPQPEVSLPNTLKVTVANNIQAISAGALALILSAVGLWALLPHQTDMKITGFQWHREISVEVYKTVQLEAWEGELPSDARVLSHSREKHPTEQMVCGSHEEPYQDCKQVQTGSEPYVCGQIDLGNGYFEDVECQRPIYTTQCDNLSRTVTDYCPVYKEKYIYEAERWVHSRTPQASGNDQSPSWPEFTLASNERESGRTEKYSVTLTDEDGKLYKVVIDYASWLSYRLGQTLTVQVNRAGMVHIVEDK